MGDIGVADHDQVVIGHLAPCVPIVGSRHGGLAVKHGELVVHGRIGVVVEVGFDLDDLDAVLCKAFVDRIICGQASVIFASIRDIFLKKDRDFDTALSSADQCIKDVLVLSCVLELEGAQGEHRKGDAVFGFFDLVVDGFGDVVLLGVEDVDFVERLDGAVDLGFTRDASEDIFVEGRDGRRTQDHHIFIVFVVRAAFPIVRTCGHGVSVKDRKLCMIGGKHLVACDADDGDTGLLESLVFELIGFVGIHLVGGGEQFDIHACLMGFDQFVCDLGIVDVEDRSMDAVVALWVKAFGLDDFVDLGDQSAFGVLVGSEVDFDGWDGVFEGSGGVVDA